MNNIKSIELLEDWLSINWEDGTTSDAVYIWLYDNNPKHFHLTSEDRVYSTDTIPLDIKATSTELKDNKLIVSWSDDTTSQYSYDWLKHYTQVNRKPVYKRTLWKADDLTKPTIKYDEFLSQNDNMHNWMKQLVEYGIALITDAPTSEETLNESLTSIGHIRPSNFGDYFKVVSKPKAENIAYTSFALPLHSDLTYLETLPNFQFLHCVANDADGGLSTYVDGFKVAEDFREKHPEFFKILAETDVPRRYTDGERYCLTWAPLIKLAKDGHTIEEMRFSNHGAYIFDLPKEQMKKYYEAYQTFSRMAHEEKYTDLFRMSAGMIAVFDNRRLFHGRSEFYPNTGFRHLQGSYICQSEFYSKLMTLDRRKQGLNWQDYNE